MFHSNIKKLLTQNSVFETYRLSFPALEHYTPLKTKSSLFRRQSFEIFAHFRCDIGSSFYNYASKWYALNVHIVEEPWSPNTRYTE